LDPQVIAIVERDLEIIGHAQEERVVIQLHVQARDGVEREGFLAAFEIFSGDCHHAVGVQPKSVLQVAQGNIPVTGDVRVGEENG
jgi:hypothetical protein